MIHSAQINQPNWKPTMAAITLLMLWIGYWYWETLAAMAHIWWRAETYTHGLVVPPIALWLVWRDRHRPAAMQPQATLWLALPLTLFMLLWLVGDLTAINALTQFSVAAVIVLSIMAMVGLPISKELAFPLLFLFFAVPIGDFLMPQLMEWTADFTVLALRLTGIPVYREGQQFVIPSGQWSVIEACSGIRYLIASMTVGTLYAYLTYTSLKRRLTFILVSMLVPIVANWLRAYLIVLLGHVSGNKLAVGLDHLIYGWIFFGIVIAIMFAIGMRWAEPSRTDLPLPKTGTDHRVTTSVPWLVGLAVAFLIAAGPVTESTLRRANTGTEIKLSPPELPGMKQAESLPTAWQPQFANPTAQIHTAYGTKDSWVGLYLAYYRNQNYESKLVTSTNVLAISIDPNWQVVSSGSAKVSLAGSEQRIRTAELLHKTGSQDERYTVWQWYWINGHLTSSDFEAKWLTAWAMLTGQGDDSAAVIIYAPKDHAEATLPAFASERAAALDRALSEARQK